MILISFDVALRIRIFQCSKNMTDCHVCLGQPCNESLCSCAHVERCCRRKRICIMHVVHISYCMFFNICLTVIQCAHHCHYIAIYFVTVVTFVTFVTIAIMWKWLVTLAGKEITWVWIVEVLDVVSHKLWLRWFCWYWWQSMITDWSLISQLIMIWLSQALAERILTLIILIWLAKGIVGNPNLGSVIID